MFSYIAFGLTVISVSLITAWYKNQCPLTVETVSIIIYAMAVASFVLFARHVLS